MLECDLILQEDKHVKYNLNCRVLAGTPTDVLLGIDFLMKNDAIINIKDGIIVLDGKEYEIARENKNEMVKVQTSIL